MWTAALNSNVFGADQSPNYVEDQVLTWFKEKIGVGYCTGCANCVVDSPGLTPLFSRDSRAAHLSHGCSSLALLRSITCSDVSPKIGGVGASSMAR